MLLSKTTMTKQEPDPECYGTNHWCHMCCLQADAVLNLQGESQRLEVAPYIL